MQLFFVLLANLRPRRTGANCRERRDVDGNKAPATGIERASCRIVDSVVDEDGGDEIRLKVRVPTSGVVHLMRSQMNVANAAGIMNNKYNLRIGETRLGCARYLRQIFDILRGKICDHVEHVVAASKLANAANARLVSPAYLAISSRVSLSFVSSRATSTNCEPFSTFFAN